MTEAEAKQTKEFALGQAIVVNTWNEDKEKLRPENNPQIKTIEVYNKTLELLQTCWKAYKNNIPVMDTKEFWLYPYGAMMKGMNATGEVSCKESETLEWMFCMEDAVKPDSPSYGTLCKCLIRYSRLYQKLWDEKYCKLISGADRVA